MESFTYREMIAGEEQNVCDLANKVFAEFVGPEYEEAGSNEFHRFTKPANMRQRIQSGGFVLVACEKVKIVGMIEFVPPDRIAMLFVSIQGQGIATELIKRAVKKAQVEIPGIKKVTVHSSPYAEAFYSKVGFRKTGDPIKDHGIKYIPMELHNFEKSA